MLVHGVGRTVGGTGRIARGLVLAVVDGHLAPHDLQDQLFGLVDAVVHAGEEHGLAVKAGSLHVLVRRHDDAVAGCDLLAGQDVLGTVGTVGLDLHRQLQLGACLGQRLGGHVGVGDAVGAGRHSQHPEAVLRDGLVGEALAAELCFLLLVDGVQKCLRRSGSAQLLHELLVHQHLHHPGQHIHMQAAVLRGRDGEEQVGLAVVVGVVLHRAAQPQCGQTGPGDDIALGMWNRDAVVHVGGAFFFAGVECLFIGLFVQNVVVGGLQLHDLVDDLILIGCCNIQRNGIQGEKRGDTHRGILLSFVQSVTAQSAASSASISDFLASPRLNAVALPQAVPRRRASS